MHSHYYTMIWGASFNSIHLMKAVGMCVHWAKRRMMLLQLQPIKSWMRWFDQQIDFLPRLLWSIFIFFQCIVLSSKINVFIMHTKDIAIWIENKMGKVVCTIFRQCCQLHIFLVAPEITRRYFKIFPGLFFLDYQSAKIPAKIHLWIRAVASFHPKSWQHW